MGIKEDQELSIFSLFLKAISETREDLEVLNNILFTCVPLPDGLDFAYVERFSQLFCPGSCLGVTVQVVVFAYNAWLIP